MSRCKSERVDYSGYMIKNKSNTLFQEGHVSLLWYSQAGLDARSLHTGSAGRVPATEGVSGQNTLSTGPVERAVGCWDPHHTL